jgi:dihydropteroate synthase
MSTHLVGILNVTPNSFSDGGLFLKPNAALDQARKLFADGASIVDVGAEATNPWAEPLIPKDEWARLELVLPVLLKEFPGKLSIDTYHAETAEKALKLGDIWINDVMTFRDPMMIEIAVKYNATCIVSHAPLAAKSVKESHKYKIDDIQVVVDELKAKRKEMIKAGVKPDKIILDPGVGFGKTMRLNWQLLEFKKCIDGPVMLGHSRKRFLGTDPNTGESLPDGEEIRYTPKRNIEAGLIVIAAGTDYLRVHDIAQHAQLQAK